MVTPLKTASQSRHDVDSEVHFHGRSGDGACPFRFALVGNRERHGGPGSQEGRGRRTEARHSVRAVRTKAVVAMLYLVLLAPIGAIALLISMSSLERWQEADSHPLRSTQSDAGRRRHRDAP